MVSKNKMREDMHMIERTICAAKIIMQSHAARMAQFAIEQADLDARKAQAIKDFEQAPKMLKDANSTLASAKTRYNFAQLTGGGAPLKREPKTKQEKMLERRARLLRGIGNLEAQLDD